MSSFIFANCTPSPKLATLRRACTLPALLVARRPRLAEPDPDEFVEEGEEVGRRAGASEGLGLEAVVGGKRGRGERGGEGEAGVEGVSGIEPGPRGEKGRGSAVEASRA